MCLASEPSCLQFPLPGAPLYSSPHSLCLCFHFLRPHWPFGSQLVTGVGPCLLPWHCQLSSLCPSEFLGSRTVSSRCPGLPGLQSSPMPAVVHSEARGQAWVWRLGEAGRWVRASPAGLPSPLSPLPTALSLFCTQRSAPSPPATLWLHFLSKLGKRAELPRRERGCSHRVRLQRSSAQDWARTAKPRQPQPGFTFLKHHSQEKPAAQR